MATLSDPHLKLKVSVSLAAAAAISARLIWPTLSIDATVLGLIVVGVLPWLGPIIKSVRLPGGLELELHELKQKTDEAKGAAESARQRAEFALTQPTALPESDHQALHDQRDEAHWQEQAGKLVEEYNTLRRDVPSGWDRTSKMASVVKRMIQLAHDNAKWNVLKHLEHSERGWRLMAYAWLYARSELRFLSPLTENAYRLRDDNKPFGQYWSILAIERVLSTRGNQPVPDDVINTLRSFLAWVEPGTDRHYELRRVVESAKPQNI